MKNTIVSLWYKAAATAIMMKDKQYIVITSDLASFLRKSLETRLPHDFAPIVHQTQLQLVIVAPFPHWRKGSGFETTCIYCPGFIGMF